MNILILQGSPRAKGDTAWLVEEFKKTSDNVGDFRMGELIPFYL